MPGFVGAVAGVFGVAGLSLRPGLLGLVGGRSTGSASGFLTGVLEGVKRGKEGVRTSYGDLWKCC